MQADSSDSGDDIDDASLSADHKSAWRPEDCKPASPTTAMPPLATGKPFPTGPARARKSSDVLSDTLKSKKIAASSFVTNVEKAARNRINALLTLGRQKPHSDTDPPASLFSVEGHANFFASFDESVYVDPPSLEI